MCQVIGTGVVAMPHCTGAGIWRWNQRRKIGRHHFSARAVAPPQDISDDSPQHLRSACGQITR